MDTRYWGPSGWKLLHTITFSYDHSLKKSYEEFFESIAYILPCKFCRKSFSEYITEDPVDASSKAGLTRWLWRIHNKVNEKLRSQRLCYDKDPPFSKVKQTYSEEIDRGCSKVNFQGWEFLFSVVEAHPTSKLSLASKAFDVPDKVSTNTPLLRNLYNTILPEEKLQFYKKFWELLPTVLPFKEWRTVWKKYDSHSWNTRRESLSNLYSIRCKLENELELQNRTDFSSLCKVLRTYKSGCNKSKRSKTCRKK